MEMESEWLPQATCDWNLSKYSIFCVNSDNHAKRITRTSPLVLLQREPHRIASTVANGMKICTPEKYTIMNAHHRRAYSIDPFGRLPGTSHRRVVRKSSNTFLLISCPIERRKVQLSQMMPIICGADGKQPIMSGIDPSSAQRISLILYCVCSMNGRQKREKSSGIRHYRKSFWLFAFSFGWLKSNEFLEFCVHHHHHRRRPSKFNYSNKSTQILRASAPAAHKQTPKNPRRQEESTKLLRLFIHSLVSIAGRARNTKFYCHFQFRSPNRI